MARWQRLIRHWLITRRTVKKRFTPEVLDRIEAVVNAAEASHCGEIEVVIETDLHERAILSGQTPRQRAIEVFGVARVWDTEANNGVLIYILFADHAVEIVADRGFNGLVTADEWAHVCRRMEADFRQGNWAQGALAGVQGVAALISKHFPESGRAGNELPDRPIIL
jgi:uncharacterized membrane protein